MDLFLTKDHHLLNNSKFLLVRVTTATEPFNVKVTGTTVWPFLYRYLPFLSSSFLSHFFLVFVFFFVFVSSIICLSRFLSNVLSSLHFSLLALRFFQ